MIGVWHIYYGILVDINCESRSSLKFCRWRCHNKYFKHTSCITHLAEIDESSKSPIFDSYFKSLLAENKLLTNLFSTKFKDIRFQSKAWNIASVAPYLSLCDFSKNWWYFISSFCVVVLIKCKEKKLYGDNDNIEFYV
jgi:hypothetical protein